ncbi:MAG: hypothetical protein ACLP1X_24455 [Polyangiaceae bacterium]
MEDISWLDRIEKTGRLVLWLSIASACVIVPIAYVGQKRAETKAEAELQAAVKKAEAKVEELEKGNKPGRVTFASVGSYMSAINYDKAQGSLWFSNVSPRGGILCVVGLAQEPEGVRSAVSLAACQEVGAYASAVHVPLMFAGGDLAAACPRSKCSLSFKDAPDTHE